jgi:hypothetical protein
MQPSVNIVVIRGVTPCNSERSPTLSEERTACFCWFVLGLVLTRTMDAICAPEDLGYLLAARYQKALLFIFSCSYDSVIRWQQYTAVRVSVGTTASLVGISLPIVGDKLHLNYHHRYL